MTNIEPLFRSLKVRTELLRPFGFVEGENGHNYSTALLGGRFEMTVTITEDGKIFAEVIDALSRDDYVLHLVSGAEGAFVGQVREEYERVLGRIAAGCFEKDAFKSEEARRVIEYVREKYHGELEFLWEKFSGNAIFRRQDTAKWYAALLSVQKKKIGLPGDDMVEIIDLRGRPEDISVLLDGKKYLPGYHMNKKRWFTVCLDGSVPVEEIFRRIDASYALAVK